MSCFYDLSAQPDMATDMRAALEALQQAVGGCEGCLGLNCWSMRRDDRLFLLIEHWRSVADREADGAVLGKIAFGPIMAAAAIPPRKRLIARAGG